MTEVLNCSVVSALQEVRLSCIAIAVHDYM